mmetsp:Transcript_148800/g.277370  ORF Transcript_148800/g.277370 Transcript_148800/m.277370 type:complete len:115 (+) Transcript_148800:363-707(+)
MFSSGAGTRVLHTHTAATEGSLRSVLEQVARAATLEDLQFKHKAHLDLRAVDPSVRQLNWSRRAALLQKLRAAGQPSYRQRRRTETRPSCYRNCSCGARDTALAQTARESDSGE